MVMNSFVLGVVRATEIDDGVGAMEEVEVVLVLEPEWDVVHVVECAVV